MSIDVRPVRAIAEYRAVESLQRRVWAMSDDLEVVPLHMLLTVQKQGGLLLGAFDGEKLAGFVFGYLGLTDEGKLKHCSHMMGVSPEYQSQGIGYRLKLAQREFALAQGLDLVTWTYDPLLGRNAYLNIHKLGAVCRTYIRDLYGPLADGLNAGLPTDRFQVEWWVAGEEVARRLAGEVVPASSQPAFSVNVTTRTTKGLLTPGVLSLGAQDPLLWVEIPVSFQAIKSADPALALEWRLAMRKVFEACFAASYTVVDFSSHPVEGERRGFYLLERG